MTAETLVAAAEPVATEAQAAALATPAAVAEPVAAAAPVAETPTPEVEYAFKTPDGTPPLDAKRVEAFTALAKELKLPADAAQKVVDMAAAELIEFTRSGARRHTLACGFLRLVASNLFATRKRKAQLCP